MLVSQASQVLIVVLAWPALQHGTVQSSLALDYQYWIQRTGSAHTLGNFLYFEFLVDGFGFILLSRLVLLTIVGLFAWLGSALGAAAARRAHAALLQEAPHASTASLARWLPTRARFILSMLLLGLLLWSFYVGIQMLGSHQLSASVLGRAFSSPAFIAMLLMDLCVLVPVLVIARPRAAPPDVRLAEH
ncbi:MAG TPA: hypothetical protein VKT82_03595 [Ktedonobacterales bacterium]|nr:hypothetical protein [Ktedonobacterales bacterium]